MTLIALLDFGGLLVFDGGYVPLDFGCWCVSATLVVLVFVDCLIVCLCIMCCYFCLLAIMLCLLTCLFCWACLVVGVLIVSILIFLCFRLTTINLRLIFMICCVVGILWFCLVSCIRWLCWFCLLSFWFKWDLVLSWLVLVGSVVYLDWFVGLWVFWFADVWVFVLITCYYFLACFVYCYLLFEVCVFDVVCY